MSIKSDICPGCGGPKKRNEKFCQLCRADGTAARYVEPVVESAPAEPESDLGIPMSGDDGFVFPKAELNYSDPTAQEIAQRTLARRKLIHFIRRFKPKYLPGWLHEDICRRLERFMKDVEDQKEPRLMINVPVRHGKSEIASRHFAPFVLGHHPDWEIISASGAQSLAMSFSRYIRDLVRNPSYQALFPTMRLDPSSQSVENWSTTSGGGYLAAGIGTMITGRGAHILLVDDPVKDAEAADSQGQRDAVWEWYMSTAYTRLAPGGGVLVIMTWWNDDDFAGRIRQSMATGDGDMFEIVTYPAINDQGDEYILADDTMIQLPPGSTVPEGARMTRPMNTALHPDRYSLESLLRRKSSFYALGQQRWWAALYQQNPAPDEGAYFTKKMFLTYDGTVSRRHGNVYQAWDFAITEGEVNDWTVGITLYQDEHDNLYVLDVNRFRSDDGVDIIDTVVRYAQEWDADMIGFEDGQIWKALSSTFEKACAAARYYPSYEVLKPLTDKLVRAQPLRGRMQAKKLYWPSKAPWYDELRTEFLRFPAGKHDDQIDAVAWAVRLTLSKAAPKIKLPPPPKSWKDKLGGMMNGKDGSYMAS